MPYKSAVRFVLEWNLPNKIFIFPFWVGICMRGTLKTQSFAISSTKLSFKHKIAEQKCYQFFSLVKFVAQKTEKIVILSYFPYNPKAKLRLEVLFVWGTNFCQRRWRRRVTDERKFIAFFHVLWLFIGKKHDLSKKYFQNFWSETNTFNIFHIQLRQKVSERPVFLA
jgi:hypothetical protein